jgi:hypothetical protein
MATICSADRALQTDNFVLRSSVVMVPSQGVKRSISQSTSYFEVDAALNDYSARAGRNPRLRT